MDEVDSAQARDELGLADAIRNARTPGRVVVATGRCLWCDEITADHQRWCSVSCRDTWLASAAGKGFK
jgi:hypothetical protein